MNGETIPLKGLDMWRMPTVVVVCFFAVCGTLSAGELATGPFKVRESKELRVSYHGEALIEKDRLAGLDSMANAETLKTGKVGDITALNVIRQKHDVVNFRKEVVLHKNGALELTIKANYESYTNTPRGYSFSIPFPVLKGATFKALTGRSYSTKVVTGRIVADMPEGSITGRGVATYVRFIAFKKDGLQLVFDLNPYGPVQLYTDYPFGGEPLAAGSVVRSGNAIVFNSFSRRTREFGGLYTHKILIYEGEYDYSAKHPYQRWSYRGGPGPVAHFAFGTAEPPRGITSAGITAYRTANSFGWKKPARSMKLIRTGPKKNIFANCVFSPDGTENTFIVDTKPGYYVITLQVGHPERDIGPFDISVNGERIARNVKVSAGDIRPVIVSKYLRKPDTQFHFTFSSKKDWAISCVALQLLITPNEDYFFDRKLWVVGGLFEPDFHVK